MQSNGIELFIGVCNEAQNSRRVQRDAVIGRVQQKNYASQRGIKNIWNDYIQEGYTTQDHVFNQLKIHLNRINGMNRFRNDNIKEELGVILQHLKSEERPLSWFAHLCRINSNIGKSRRYGKQKFGQIENMAECYTDEWMKNLTRGDKTENMIT